MLSERHGGFGSPYVIIIDAGNSSDIYSSVNLARQYGLDLKDMLKRIVVSRPFTIYQLANLHCLTKLRIVVTVIVHYVFSLGLTSFDPFRQTTGLCLQT